MHPKAEQALQVAVHLAIEPEPEATGAYYVDSPSDEEGGAAVEAQVDFMMGDLELLFQEQLVLLVEDLVEYQAVKKGKAMATDPSLRKYHLSIMVLEEDSAATPTRPDELITLQPGDGFRWFVQHMPHSGSAASGSTQISRQSDILPACTSENAEDKAPVELAAQTVTESTVQSVAESVGLAKPVAVE